MMPRTTTDRMLDCLFWVASAATLAMAIVFVLALLGRL
jgi:hypothetical protein